MGQLRTGNKRHKRAILAAARRLADPAVSAPVATAPATGKPH